MQAANDEADRISKAIDFMSGWDETPELKQRRAELEAAHQERIAAISDARKASEATEALRLKLADCDL